MQLISSLLIGVVLLGSALSAPGACAAVAESPSHPAFRTLHERAQLNGAMLMAKGDEVLPDTHCGLHHTERGSGARQRGSEKVGKGIKQIKQALGTLNQLRYCRVV